MAPKLYFALNLEMNGKLHSKYAMDICVYDNALFYAPTIVQHIMNIV